MITAQDLMQRSGEWLGAARAWIQRKKLNGSRVTWGSLETLEPPMSVRDVEEVAAYATAADRARIEKLVENMMPPIPEEIKKPLLKWIRQE